MTSPDGRRVAHMRRIVVISVFLAIAMAAPAQGASVQIFTDRTAAWLTTTLRTDIPTRQVVEIAPDESRIWGAQADGAVIEVDPRIFDGWRDLAREKLGGAEPCYQLIHELLHLHRATTLEEGVVDAVSLDLAPSYTASLGWPREVWAGYGDILDATYPDDVRLVRALSAAATGQRRRSRDARYWRRALLLADEPTRQAMIASANGS